MKKSLLVSAPLVLCMLATASGRADALPLFADVIAVVDESGSMAGEHAWIGGMVSSLDLDLISAGVSPNQYGLVGFGAAGGHGTTGHQHDVGGGEFGTAADFAVAAGGLVISGSLEDGYSGLNTALGYSQRAGTVQNMILVTDEDRDVANAGLTFASILAGLNRQDTLLNVVVNATFECGDGSAALGVGATGTGYKADGAGGFTSCGGATVISGIGTTVADYVQLAWATGGVAWDLNLLRLGGLTAQSFTEAFVDVKVQEITQVPEPATILLFASGAGIAAVRRVRARRS